VKKVANDFFTSRAAAVSAQIKGPPALRGRAFIGVVLVA